jgi:hypothetical protein
MVLHVTMNRPAPSVRPLAPGSSLHPRSRSLAARAAGALLVAFVAVTTVACGSDDSAEPEAESATIPDEATTEAPPATDPVATDDSEPADTSDVGGDPCDVLAGIDVAALVSEPVADPEGSDDLMGASCRVDPVSDSSAGLRVVVSDQEPTDNFENQRELFGVDLEVTGIGDKAFHSGPYLFVLDDDILVMIQVIRDSETGFNVPDAELEAAMATILTNLGR